MSTKTSVQNVTLQVSLDKKKVDCDTNTFILKCTRSLPLLAVYNYWQQVQELW